MLYNRGARPYIGATESMTRIKSTHRRSHVTWQWAPPMQRTPKVCLCHTSLNGKPVVEVLHRLFKCTAHPLESTQWDGEGFCFLGDIMRGNAIIEKVHHRWAIVKQGERRLEPQAAVDDRARETTASGWR